MVVAAEGIVVKTVVIVVVAVVGVEIAVNVVGRVHVAAGAAEGVTDGEAIAMKTAGVVIVMTTAEAVIGTTTAEVVTAMMIAEVAMTVEEVIVAMKEMTAEEAEVARVVARVKSCLVIGNALNAAPITSPRGLNASSVEQANRMMNIAIFFHMPEIYLPVLRRRGIASAIEC
mmetsp:Transcript_51679/g.82067  ORF Transcript_51679/g.82067 Transcript_51679/m.82067 type:complete len:172 (-) Transcript_51679:7-522(-)